MLEYNSLWGVDVAIKKLRPYANFQLEGTRFTIWDCPENSQPPNWEEIIAQVEKDKLIAESQLLTANGTSN
jgi:hypothetical protein